MNNHFNRCKVLYVQLLVSVASSLAGELGAMKELTPEQLHAVTWVVWTLLLCNVIASAGNTLVASLHQPPTPPPAAPAPPPVQPPQP